MENKPVTWELLDQVIDETMSECFSTYLMEDIENLRYNYREDDREKIWCRYKRTYSELYKDDTWQDCIAKRYKYN
jgi:hypothetical protein